MKKYFSPLVCGFGAAVISIVPGMRNFGCCLLVPAAAIFSILLHQKATNSKTKVDDNIAIMFGLLTGIFAAVFTSMFDVILTLITHTNDFVEAIPQSEALLREFNLGSLMNYSIGMFNKIAVEIRTTGFSLYYTLIIFVSNIIMFLIFG
jgi:hypothetical protein